MNEQPPWDTDEWAHLVMRFADNYLGIHRHTMLNRHDRDDIKQEALIRVWNRRDTFDSTKGTFPAWIKTLVENHIRNEYRNRLCWFNGKTPNGKRQNAFRRAFKHPNRITTRLVNPDDEDGERDEIVYVPDVVDPHSESTRAMDTTSFLAKLSCKERKVLTEMLSDEPPSYRVGSYDYQRFAKAKHLIRQKWKRELSISA